MPPNQTQNYSPNPYDQNNQQFTFDPYSQTPTDPYNNQFGQSAPVNDPYNTFTSGQGQAYDPNQQFTSDPYNQPSSDNPYAANSFQPQVSNNPYDSLVGDPNQFYDPNNQQYIPTDPYTDPNLFQEKKAGNNKLLFIIIGIIVVLLVAGGVVAYFTLINQPGTNNQLNNQPPLNNNSNSNNDNQPQPPAQLQVDISKTGGPRTPATNARLYSLAELPKDWVAQKFRGQFYIDASGNCTNQAYCGPQADPDGDGVINIEEYNFGLDPLNPDTDNDGIADGDELYIYYTNPAVVDSDGDGYADSVEIINCYDPTNITSQKMVFRSTNPNYLDLSTIESNVQLNSLKSVTQQTLSKAKGFVNSDLRKGYIAANCTSSETDSSGNNSPSNSNSSNDEDLAG